MHKIPCYTNNNAGTGIVIYVYYVSNIIFLLLNTVLKSKIITFLLKKLYWLSTLAYKKGTKHDFTSDI